MPLLALRSASLVVWGGAGADDVLSTYHDRIREAVVEALGPEALAGLHLALGRALARRHARDPAATWVLEAARHLGEAGALIDDDDERVAVARLQCEAGKQARASAAFPLAFTCFERGLAFLPPGAWDSDYALTLALHVGATECAYLSHRVAQLHKHIAEVKSHARSPLDQMSTWEVEIDSLVGTQAFAEAIDAGAEALALLGVELQRDPTEADVGAAIHTLLSRLEQTTPEQIEALHDLDDPEVEAAMRIQVRLSPVAYVGRPLLLPLIACNLITTSIDRGLSNATPYALGLFGLVLASLEKFAASQQWAQLALRLLDRFPDRSLEAATRHLVFNFCCLWTVPLASALPQAREIFDIGCRTGDFEYAAYGAHNYVLNASYSGAPLGPLVDEAAQLTEKMRELGSVNGLHLHLQVERWLRVLTAGADEPGTLNGDGFDEQEVLATMLASGSRSGAFLIHMMMGLARFYFGDRADALACFESAHACADAVPATWHLPMLYQHAALSACARLAQGRASPEDTAACRARIEHDLAGLRRLAAHHKGNFAHRVKLVEGAVHHLDGDKARALSTLSRAVEQARQGGWMNDVALAHQLSMDFSDDEASARRARRAARAAYAAWGAFAKAEQLAATRPAMPR